VFGVSGKKKYLLTLIGDIAERGPRADYSSHTQTLSLVARDKHDFARWNDIVDKKKDIEQKNSSKWSETFFLCLTKQTFLPKKQTKKCHLRKGFATMVRCMKVSI